MTKKLRALLERKQATAAKARAILDVAEKDGRDLADAESSEWDALMGEIDAINASIDREQALMAAERDLGALQVPDGASIIGGRPVADNGKNHGFTNLAEFAKAVASVTQHHVIDERLHFGAAAPTTYGNEGTGADGGFLVPAEFSTSIWSLSTSLEEGSFLPLTEQNPVQGNSMTFPSDETTPWGTDGVRAYWESEASAATQTKPVLKPNTMRLKKLTALVPVSEELLADSVGLPAYLTAKASESIRWKVNDAIINGSGVGMPLGIASHAAEVSQAKETSQTADTINSANVSKMFPRLLRPGRGTWLINPDAWGQLPQMTIGDQPVFIMPNGLQSAPGGFLMGRPVLMSDTCQTLGDKGDIRLVDFGMYRTLTKQGGIESATSMHLYFDAAAVAFRFIFRIDGQPILSAAVTPPNSSVTRSGYVTLDARA